ncbi:MAG TPA: hypothetical protein VKA02_05435 [Candidatus Acidoferrum sp.]|nr:hypothetical protein [Candidatus Acidoferrum sp.]
MKIHLFTMSIILLAIIGAGEGRLGNAALFTGDTRAANVSQQASAKNFDASADAALVAMKKHATELKIGGVAVVAYFEGDSLQAWSSKMVVVGRMKDAPSTGNNGSNLLGIAYAKAAEMADTLQNSGSGTRPPMIGEFGWQGGVIARAKTGYVIAAFSGGKSEDDVEVSKAGLEALKGAL